jgi:hypothetical protein
MMRECNVGQGFIITGDIGDLKFVDMYARAPSIFKAVYERERNLGHTYLEDSNLISTSASISARA